jgi:hypothetical protein
MFAAAFITLLAAVDDAGENSFQPLRLKQSAFEMISDKYPCWSRKGWDPFASVPEQSVCQDDQLSHDGGDGEFCCFAVGFVHTKRSMPANIW